MIVDFHTHIWPNKIAAKVVENLGKFMQKGFVPFSDGTADGLVKTMQKNGIDISVVQPVVTKPSQTSTINQFAAEINENFNGRLISFGGIWPFSENYKAEIDDICAKGLKGIKLHPEYQNFSLLDEKFLPLCEYALSRDLILLFHAGYDPAYAECHTKPKDFADLRKKMGGGTIIAAHLGGFKQTDQVLDDLAGSDVYLDTAFGFDYYGTENFIKIVKSHGAEKILFATDSPWSNAKIEIETIKNLPLKKEEIELILGLNAKRILKL